MLTNALLVLVTVVGGVLLYAASRPDTFRVERSVVINRTPVEIFPLLDNFHNWVRLVAVGGARPRHAPDVPRSRSGKRRGIRVGG